jgi:ATP-dependent exoDNAse (exonuclease V) beta subunit
MWLTVEEQQLRAALDQAVETVLRVASAPFWGEAQRGDHGTEAPFAIIRTPQSLITGVIDLIFGSEQGWHVRDYKTDVSLNPDSYQAQLDAYASALRAMGLKVADVGLIQVRALEDAPRSADPTAGGTS